MVHKDLMAAKEPKSTTLYDSTFIKALNIGGSYSSGTRVFVGAAPLGNHHALDHYVEVDNAPVSVSIQNPMYIPGGALGLAALLDSDEIVDDPMWPRDKESVVFTELSNIEDTIVAHRHETIMGSPCPSAFLPSQTNML